MTLICANAGYGAGNGATDIDVNLPNGWGISCIRPSGHQSIRASTIRPSEHQSINHQTIKPSHQRRKHLIVVLVFMSRCLGWFSRLISFYDGYDLVRIHRVADLLQDLRHIPFGNGVSHLWYLLYASRLAHHLHASKRTDHANTAQRCIFTVIFITDRRHISYLETIALTVGK
eukprot:413793-Amorphochlora_amoeboformis.AAC.4